MSGAKDKVKDSERFSFITESLDKCYICGCSQNIAIHEIFYGTANRKKSKEDGMVVGLCGPHHNLSNNGVHFNEMLDNRLKAQAEKIWIEIYAKDKESYDDKINYFIKRYGKNYL